MPETTPLGLDDAASALTIWFDEHTWLPFAESERADITSPGHWDKGVFIEMIYAYDRKTAGPDDDLSAHGREDVAHTWALVTVIDGDVHVREAPQSTPGAIPTTIIWGSR